ncbi:MAG: 2-oxo acid dehydrogenase subunit E2 [Chloroflexi bacterium]|nr:2-oxo acid dehydrogenase subunit E2 [Chloroflexota bacterium]
MATDIIMPNLGFDVQQARLIEWVKKPGDTIKQGEILAVVESDKANVELESIASGVILEQLAEAGVEVPVGSVIARIGQATEMKTAAPTVQPAPSTPAARPEETSKTADVSPIARRLAEDNKVDLTTLTGSGPRGRITKEDVEAAIAKPATLAIPGQGAETGGVRALPKVRKAAREAGIDLATVLASGAHGVTTMADLETHQQLAKPVQPTPAAQPVIQAAPVAPATPSPMREGAQVIPLSRMRQIIGKRLSDSMREAPHFYVTGEFDLDSALKRLNTLPEPRPGVNVLIQYLAIQALRRVPALNATYENETLYRHDSVNLAVAVALEDGLLTPVLAGAERFSLEGLAQETRGLIQRTRANKLQPNDLQGGTFTISNLGVIRQVDQFTAVINPPQVAILAVGTVKQRPVVIDGGLHIHQTVHLTLSGDHRVVDGMHLGQFMAAFQAELDYFSK